MIAVSVPVGSMANFHDCDISIERSRPGLKIAAIDAILLASQLNLSARASWSGEVTVGQGRAGASEAGAMLSFHFYSILSSH